MLSPADAFQKEAREYRFTLGPVYAPDRLDAHDEYTTEPELFRAMIDYALKTDRRLRLQHDVTKTCATIIGALPWPYDHEVSLEVPGKGLRKVKLPAGTWYMGVVWDAEYWPLVKAGKIAGFSIGGRATRKGFAYAVQEPSAAALALRYGSVTLV